MLVYQRRFDETVEKVGNKYKDMAEKMEHVSWFSPHEPPGDKANDQPSDSHQYFAIHACAGGGRTPLRRRSRDITRG